MTAERKLYTITVIGADPNKKIILRDYKPPDIRIRPTSYKVQNIFSDEVSVMATEYTITVGFSGTDPIMQVRAREYKQPFTQDGMFQLHYTGLDGNPGCVIFNSNVPVVIEPIS